MDSVGLHLFNITKVCFIHFAAGYSSLVHHGQDWRYFIVGDEPTPHDPMGYSDLIVWALSYRNNIDDDGDDGVFFIDGGISGASSYISGRGIFISVIK